MAFIKEAKKYKIRTLKTIVLSLVFVGLGLYASIPGPTLLDLQILADTSLDKIAMILPSRSGGYAVGSIFSGLITDFIDHQILLMISLIISIISFTALPFFGSLTKMCLIIFVAGFAAGIIDTVGNVWTIHLWAKENPPFMQLVHFAFGIGAFVGPFIAQPFLLNNFDEDIKSLNFTNNTVNFATDNFEFEPMRHDFLELEFYSDINNSILFNKTKLNKSNLENVNVQWVYFITSFYNLAVLILFIVVYYLYPDNLEHPSRLKKIEIPEKFYKQIDGNIEKSLEMSIDSTASTKDDLKIKDEWTLIIPLSDNLRKIVIVLSTLFMHLYCGLEISFGSLLATFAVKSNLMMSKSEGSFLCSVYWGMFTFFRIFSLIGITYLSPRFLLIFNMSLIMLSNGFLLPFANTYKWALWIGSALMGLGCSSVFATMFAFLEQLTPVTSKITSGFMVSACIGEFIIPYIVGIYIETNPEVYLYVIFAYSFSSLIFLSILFLIQIYVLRKQKIKLNL